MTIDSALEAKVRGLKTIGVTSTSFTDHVSKDHLLVIPVDRIFMKL
jgi:hypothetical protein